MLQKYSHCFIQKTSSLSGLNHMYLGHMNKGNHFNAGNTLLSSWYAYIYIYIYTHVYLFTTVPWSLLMIIMFRVISYDKWNKGRSRPDRDVGRQTREACVYYNVILAEHYRNHHFSAYTRSTEFYINSSRFTPMKSCSEPPNISLC